ncbi:flavin reductase [Nesterenkonia sp. K-15-9-6]|uniref:flavin reductase n=1 Tax=Nesterenkonia sp. K-15-9-6 TaxID=3093918 RepID=UPI0040450D2C
MQQLTTHHLEYAWQQAWTHGDVSALTDLMAPDYRRVSRSSGATLTAAELEEEILSIRQGFPDIETTIDSLVAEEERLVVFWSTRGTHTESFLGVPPTGRTVKTYGTNLITLHDGQIVHEEVTWDGTEMLHSLGIRHLSDAGSPVQPVRTDDLSGSPDPEILKTFNRQFVTGVTVVTTQDDEGRPRGLAVNAYTSVSLEPPLVLVCIQKSSSTYPALFSATHLGINILGTRQRETIATFASKASDKFASVDWHPAPAGSPLIDGSPASLEAEIRDRFQAKTHTVFICRVGHAEVTDADPMLYKAGSFFDSDGLTQI